MIADPTNPAREDIKLSMHSLPSADLHDERLEIMFVTSVIIVYLNLQQANSSVPAVCAMLTKL